MTDARAQILAGLRRALGRKPEDQTARQAVEARLAARIRGPVPAAIAIGPDEQIAMFRAKAEAVAATVDHIAGIGDLAAAVADYLAARNLAPEVVVTPDPLLDSGGWAERPLLKLRRGMPGAGDGASVTCAFAGVAETGSAVLWSNRDNPHSASFLPDTNIVVVPAKRIVAGLDDVWDRLRAQGAVLPRAVGLITGPSRTGDIEQKIELGAHGPRRLHLVIVDDHGA